MIKVGILFLAILSIVSLAFAADESLTITTYYPSPYGSYNQLSIHRSVAFNNVGDVTNTSNTHLANPSVGELAYGNKGTSATDGFYYYKDNTWKSIVSDQFGWVTIPGNFTTRTSIVTVDVNGTMQQQNNTWVFWNDTSNHTPRQICEDNGYTYATGACTTVYPPGTSNGAEGSIVAKWVSVVGVMHYSFACHVGNMHFNADSNTKILCVR
jgi:hypothetical protein